MHSSQIFSTCIIEYSIFRSAITPEAFFDKYIRTRTPCILTNIPAEDPHWSRIRRWVAPPDFPTTSRTSRFGYIKLAAGDEIVQVETRCKPSSDGKVNAEFGGGGRRLRMPFGEFLERLEHGDTDVYMTTQYQTEDERHSEEDLRIFGGDDDEDEAFEAGNDSTQNDMDALLEQSQTITEYLQPPLSQLSADFPKHPKVFGYLVPQQVNLWMGCGPPESEGMSSGLHHDFADNLYVLLRGRKRFTMFSPKDAVKMEMHGKIAKVHQNGLIAYENDNAAKIPRADGAFPHDVAKWKLKELEKRKKELEMLSELVDNDEDDDEGADAMDVDDDTDDMDEEQTVPRLSKPDKGKQPYTPESSKRNKSTDQNGQTDETDTPEEKPYPRSFSRIDVATLRKYVDRGEVVDRTLEGTTPIVVDLKEGEMLYLPTGWFHEVTSFGNSNMREDDPSERIHVAFNYWMHPPTESSFNAPYADAYCESHWFKFDSF
ncbi:cupin-like domain-containing protein [Cladochytrium replicatum]|nr:cupin-like domain-containing protein [Cladochytrium replicatum]